MKIRKLPPPGVVIHHSLTKDNLLLDDTEAIRRYHIAAPEYMMEDIGYHFVIERNKHGVGTNIGRPINTIGGHTKGHNNKLGVCVIGNFDLAAPDDQLIDALVILSKNIMKIFPTIKPTDFHRHSEYAPKTCPGKHFPWREFIERLM